MDLKKNRIIILDNFLEETFVSDLQKKLNKDNISETWYNKEEKHFYSDLCQIFLQETKNYYDLSNCIGYEIWTQNNTRPSDWHYDKDENFFNLTGNYKFPICSIVYYLNVNNLIGGLLHLDSCIITPKINRLVIFPPGVIHYVEEFLGERTSILLNPWDYRLDTDGL